MAQPGPRVWRQMETRGGDTEAAAIRPSHPSALSLPDPGSPRAPFDSGRVSSRLLWISPFGTWKVEPLGRSLSCFNFADPGRLADTRKRLGGFPSSVQGAPPAALAYGAGTERYVGLVSCTYVRCACGTQSTYQLHPTQVFVEMSGCVIDGFA